jgi:hypothetical protein
MGLLDDAIREHLDLKRRRGADPTEIERAEREALGPVRRGPEPVESDQLPGEPGDELLPEFEPGTAPEWEEEPAAYPDDPTQLHEPLPDPPLDEDEAYHAPLPREEPDAYRHPLPAEEEPSDEEERFEDEAAHPAPHAAPGPPPLSDETIEYSVEETTGEKDEDVLEETPEFLQDAPEHDRLWFEQRPPRDFDFNE